MDTAAIPLRLPSFERLVMLFLDHAPCVTRSHKSPIKTRLFPFQMKLSIAVEAVSLFAKTGGKEGKIFVVVLARMPI